MLPFFFLTNFSKNIISRYTWIEHFQNKLRSILHPYHLLSQLLEFRTTKRTRNYKFSKHKIFLCDIWRNLFVIILFHELCSVILTITVVVTCFLNFSYVSKFDFILCSVTFHIWSNLVCLFSNINWLKLVEQNSCFEQLEHHSIMSLSNTDYKEVSNSFKKFKILNRI